MKTTGKKTGEIPQNENLLLTSEGIALAKVTQSSFGLENPADLSVTQQVALLNVISGSSQSALLYSAFKKFFGSMEVEGEPADKYIAFKRLMMKSHVKPYELSDMNYHNILEVIQKEDTEGRRKRVEFLVGAYKMFVWNRTQKIPSSSHRINEIEIVKGFLKTYEWSFSKLFLDIYNSMKSQNTIAIRSEIHWKNEEKREKRKKSWF